MVKNSFSLRLAKTMEKDLGTEIAFILFFVIVLGWIFNLILKFGLDHGPIR